MKVKTSKLIGLALDWAVAEAEGLRPFIRPKGIEVLFAGLPRRVPFFPSTDWAQAGLIIEREMREHGFDVWRTADMAQCAATYERGLPDSYIYGTTPLIAAMRCYVASKLGEEVEIPEALTS